MFKNMCRIIIPGLIMAEEFCKSAYVYNGE